MTIDTPSRAPSHFDISALFDAMDRIEEAVYALGMLGIPRDLVDVAVSPEVGAQLAKGRARKLGHDAVRFAGLGALVGLIAGIVVSVVFVALPGSELPRSMTYVQLLGPNAGTLIGAMIGALFGAFRRLRPTGEYARALEHDCAVLVVRHLKAMDTDPVADLLRQSGGRDVRVEPEVRGRP